MLKLVANVGLRGVFTLSFVRSMRHLAPCHFSCSSARNSMLGASSAALNQVSRLVQFRSVLFRNLG